MTASEVIPLYGIGCGRCSQPGYSHNTRLGTTEHMDQRLKPCSTKPPAALVATPLEVKP